GLDYRDLNRSCHGACPRSGRCQGAGDRVEGAEGAGMIVPPTGVRVLVATKPVDFRKGMDGLAAYVEQQLQVDLFSGVIYVFRAKRADKSSCCSGTRRGWCW